MKKILLILTLLTLSVAAKANETNIDDVLKKRLDSCKSHFDIKPYLEIALSNNEELEITYEIAKTLESYGETGELKLTSVQQKDPIAIKCAAYAEGFMTSSAYLQLVMALAKATADAVGNDVGNKAVENVEKVVEGVKKGVKETLNNSNDK